MAEKGGCSVSDMAERLGGLQLSDVVVGQADGAHLALALQFEQRCQYSSSGVPSSAGQCIW